MKNAFERADEGNAATMVSGETLKQDLRKLYTWVHVKDKLALAKFLLQGARTLHVWSDFLKIWLAFMLLLGRLHSLENEFGGVVFCFSFVFLFLLCFVFNL